MGCWILFQEPDSLETLYAQVLSDNKGGFNRYQTKSFLTAWSLQ